MGDKTNQGTPEASELKKTQKQELDKTNFRRFMRFGIVDSTLLLASLLAGFSLDAIIARRIGVRVLITKTCLTNKGYGPIVGAGIGNAVADCVAGMPEGKWAALGVGTGATIPLIPIFVAMGLKRPFTGSTVYVVGGTSGILFAGIFYLGNSFDH